MKFSTSTVLKFISTAFVAAACACTCAACGDTHRSSGNSDGPATSDDTSGPGDDGSGSGTSTSGGGSSTTTTTTDDEDAGPKFDVGWETDGECAPDIAARYYVSDAHPDPGVSNASDVHGIWAPHFFCDGGVARWTFDAGESSELIVYDDGEARLTGHATVLDDGCNGDNVGDVWIVDVTLDEPAIDAPVKPKRELKNPAKNQPTSITDEWDYWYISPVPSKATLTSFVGQDGATIKARPQDGTHGFQMGDTASGKNLNFGASVWFYYNRTIVGPPGGPSTSRLGKGDINVDLVEICSD